MSFPDRLLRDIRHEFEVLLEGVRESVESMTLDEILERKNPLVRMIFARNPREYLFFFLAERAERSLVTRHGNVIESVVRKILEHRGAEIVGAGPADWKPFDLKFRLPGGAEYWIEIKSILGQNKSNLTEIRRIRGLAEGEGKQFRLCVYYDTKGVVPADLKPVTLVGREFWTFVGGSEGTRDRVFDVVEGLGEEFSLRAVIDAKVEELGRQVAGNLGSGGSK
ncbi:MAG: hypothetical protein ACTSU5_02900 [Promethearchaeota archaeon]